MSFLHLKNRERRRSGQFSYTIEESIQGEEEKVSSSTQVDIILHEHDMLREEIMERMRNQNNYMLIAVTILGAILGYLGKLYDYWSIQQIGFEVVSQFDNLPIAHLPEELIKSIDHISILSGFLDPAPNTDILRFLSEPLPMIITFVGAIVLDSIAALFIYNEKNKALTVKYIYGTLAPRINALTLTDDSDYKHMSWQKMRREERFKKKESTYHQAFLFSSNYLLTLVSSVVLFISTIWGIIKHVGFCNQHWVFIVFEPIYCIFTAILFLSAYKTFRDKKDDNEK